MLAACGAACSRLHQRGNARGAQVAQQPAATPVTSPVTTFTSTTPMSGSATAPSAEVKETSCSSGDHCRSKKISESSPVSSVVCPASRLVSMRRLAPCGGPLKTQASCVPLGESATSSGTPGSSNQRLKAVLPGRPSQS